MMLPRLHRAMLTFWTLKHSDLIKKKHTANPATLWPSCSCWHVCKDKGKGIASLAETLLVRRWKEQNVGNCAGLVVLGGFVLCALSTFSEKRLERKPKSARKNLNLQCSTRHDRLLPVMSDRTFPSQSFYGETEHKSMKRRRYWAIDFLTWHLCSSCYVYTKK